MILVLPLHLTNYHSGLFLPGNIFTQFAHCDETLITQKLTTHIFAVQIVALNMAAWTRVRLQKVEE